MADPVVLDKMRPAPMGDLPVLSKFKRKRADSASGSGLSRLPQDKKPRSKDGGTKVHPSTQSRPLSKSKAEHTLTQASNTPADPTPAATYKYPLPPAGEPASSSTIPDSQKLASLDQHSTTAHHENMSTLHAMPFMADDGVSRLQGVIENQFNMQILTKHNELRLIEQELAKCQVALEQLRRVELRPYPGNGFPSEAVSTGTGPAIAPLPGYTQPTHPAPYGVTDGPYTRHYNQWLLHDPLFDPASAQSPFYVDSLAQAAGRSTRNSGSARKSISKPFTFPARTDSLHSIPNYPSPAVKDKSSPLVLKRSTDNQFVKLICNNCLRGNFSSIQGFLNHCRIAHKVDYKSHDAAAIDCGRLLDENEAATLPLETQATPSHKPSLSRISTSTVTPYRGNLVHPLNTPAGASAPLATRPDNTGTRAPVRNLTIQPPSASDSPFSASAQAPRLSAHFAKHHVGGDLATVVAAAKQKLDLGLEDEETSPDISGQNSPLEALPGSRTLSGLGRASKMPGARPSSSKGIRQNQRQPKPSPLTPALSSDPMRHGSSEIPESPQYPLSSSSAATFSPHTADSAPGLVSDHEEDDRASVSEEDEDDEAHHASGNPPQTNSLPASQRPLCSSDPDVNMEIAVAGEEDEHTIDGAGAVIIRRNGFYADEERALRGAPPKSRKFKRGGAA